MVDKIEKEGLESSVEKRQQTEAFLVLCRCRCCVRCESLFRFRLFALFFLHKQENADDDYPNRIFGGERHEKTAGVRISHAEEGLT